MQSIASWAPASKVWASAGAILPCASSAVTVLWKSLSFWMASAFLPSSSFWLALVSLAGEVGSLGRRYQIVDLSLAICDGLLGLGRRGSRPQEYRH